MINNVNIELDSLWIAVNNDTINLFKLYSKETDHDLRVYHQLTSIDQFYANLWQCNDGLHEWAYNSSQTNESFANYWQARSTIVNWHNSKLTNNYEHLINTSKKWFLLFIFVILPNNGRLYSFEVSDQVFKTT